MPERRILLGVVGRPHGVRGLSRVVSYTADPASLTAYGALTDDKGRRFTLRWRGEGIAEIAEMVDGRPVPAADRNAAEKLVNTRLYIDRARLPPPEEDEFYLADLVGLQAIDAEGATLGTVVAVHDYGAGASIEIARAESGPLLVPFTRASVPEVDPAAGRLTVLPPDETAVPERAA
jgi:16S rRNA processing protein RimM